MSHYLVYWKRSTVESHWDMGSIAHTASEQYGKLESGDVLWIVASRGADDLVLIGRQKVDRVVGRYAAQREMGTLDLWDAEFHAICDEPEETVMIDISDLARQLRFDGVRDRLPRGFTGQHLQAMRRLDYSSAQAIEDLWSRRQSIGDTAW